MSTPIQSGSIVCGATMILENIDQEIKIQNLVGETEAPKPVLFDEQRDIFETSHGPRIVEFLNSWKKNFLENQPVSTPWFDWETTYQLHGARALAILFPEKRKDLLVEEELQNVKDVLEGQFETNIHNYIKLASSIKIAWGLTAEEIGFDDEKQEKVLYTMNLQQENIYTNLAANLLIINPNLKSEIKITEEIVAESDILSVANNQDSSAFDQWIPRHLADLNIISPSLTAKLKNKPEVWDALKQTFSNRLQPPDFTVLASEMKLFAADKIIIGERGIELIMPSQSLNTTQEPAPEVRRF